MTSFNAGSLIGLKARILQFEPALFGMDQGFSSCRDATDVMGLPPACKFGTAFAQTRQPIVEIAAFGLDRANEAVAHAAANSGPFKMTVIEPR